MSHGDPDLQKMVKGFRVSDLQSLLVYAGRNKGGKKNELQNRALDLIKLRSESINMKIRELHMNRYQQSRHSEPTDMYPLAAINDPMGSNYSGASNHKAPLGAAIGIPGYVPQINHQMMRSVPNLNVMPPQYPVNPDVNFKDLPFYDVLQELLKPTSLVPLRGDSLVQEKELIFYLGPQDVKQLGSSPDVQVQLRIGVLESNCEQEDDFPTSVCIKVNHKVATLPNAIPTNKPGQDPKRPKRPVDITSIVKRSTTEPQLVCVSWASSNSKPYVVGVFLVRKQTSDVLIKRLKDNGVRNPDHTTAMIKEKLCHDQDSEIASMSLRGNLICPLGKIKMMLPCRAITCTHLQCFDAHLYVQMNEKKPKWICPVCDKPAVFKSLAIDGLFLDISRKAPSECTEVQFHENGSWTPVMPVKKVTEIRETTIQPEKPKVEKQKKPVEIISLSDSDTEEETWPLQPPKKKPYKPVGVITPVSLDTNENHTLHQDPVMKSYDITQPCSSKSIPSTSKTNTLLVESSGSTLSSVYSGYIIPTTSSPTTFSPQSPPVSEAPSIGTFQESVDILNSSGAAGQCYDFDLYSLITPNTSDTFEFQDNTVNDTLPAADETPDIISID